MNVPIVISQRAVFIPHSGMAGNLSRMDRFAEHLARGATIAEASTAVGVSAPYGNSIMQRIRKRLGPQAI